jgi:hypothetical protein
LQLALGSGGGFFCVLGHFVSRFANFERRGIPVAFLSFPLRFSLALAGARASTQAQQSQQCHLRPHYSQYSC